jgi:circadian clock protein KaiB
MTWPASPPDENYVLRLFVAGATTRSQRAISNIRKICDDHLPGRCDLEVVDVYLHPEATRDYQIVATPTLVKILPEPLRRIVGDLSDFARVMASLNIPLVGGPIEALP